VNFLPDLNKITQYIKSGLSSKRYIHSVNVSATAAKLAKHYGCNVEKAEIAGLIHDCARELSQEVLLGYLEQEDIEADSVTKNVKELLHGPAAIYICRRVFGIEDGEILDAVRYHTTGRENMSLLEKIIYLSDFMEPSRCFEGVEELRDMAFTDLDKALLMAFDSSIRYIISKNALIHVDTVLSRNYLLEELRRK
jgi:predicted HD superfamily hydrolase involved in NAD metabolism